MMKTKYTPCRLTVFFIVSLISITIGCKKSENKVELPTLSTLAVKDITADVAKSGGNISSDGGALITARGVVWATTVNPAIEQHDGITNDGTGTGMYSSTLTGLQAETTYYVRAYATNSASTAYGSQVQFTTDAAGEPAVAAFTASPSSGTAPLTVSFTDQSTNNPTSWNWNFGDGSTSTQQNPSHTYQSAGDYTMQLTVSNAHGSDTETKNNYIQVESGGGQPCPGIPSLTYGGQTYNTVLIGNQCWMAENLNYETGSSWCYNNDPANCATYGRLYDWQTALNACPSGWHLPTDEEWKILKGTVDSQYGVGHSEWNGTGWRGSDVGKKLKATTGWKSGGNGTDDYGFGALAGGYRFRNGNFYYLGSNGIWWSATETFTIYAWYRLLYYDYDTASRYYSLKESGYSVRCLKD